MDPRECSFHTWRCMHTALVGYMATNNTTSYVFSWLVVQNCTLYLWIASRCYHALHLIQHIQNVLYTVNRKLVGFTIMFSVWGSLCKVLAFIHHKHLLSFENSILMRTYRKRPYASGYNHTVNDPGTKKEMLWISSQIGCGSLSQL